MTPKAKSHMIRTRKRKFYQHTEPIQDIVRLLKFSDFIGLPPVFTEQENPSETVKEILGEIADFQSIFLKHLQQSVGVTSNEILMCESLVKASPDEFRKALKRVT